MPPLTEPVPVDPHQVRPPDQTVSYGSDPAQVCDIWLPDGAALGTIFFIHGGFWRAAYDRAHVVPTALGLAAEGWAVALVEYRRVGMPGGGVPGTPEDVATALAAIAALPEVPKPLLLMGHSAGGHLAAWLATETTLPAAVRGAVPLGGVVDLGLADELNLSNGATRDFVGEARLDDPERWARFDPARRVPLVPVIALHGTLDEDVPVSVSQSYAAQWADRVTLHTAATGHYEYITPGSEVWPEVTASARALLT